MIDNLLDLAFNSNSKIFIIANELEFTGIIAELTNTHVKILTNDLYIDDHTGVKTIIVNILEIQSVCLLENVKMLNHCLSLSNED